VNVQSKIRLTLLAILSGLIAVTAGGCVRATGEFVVDQHDTVTGTVVLAVADKSLQALAGQSGQTTGELQSQIVDQVAASIGQLAAAATTETYAADGYSGAKVTIPAISLSEFGGNASIISLDLTRSEKQFHLTGQIDLPTAEDLLGYPATIDGLEPANTARISLTFTFPGPITASNGLVDGTKVTWNAKFGEVTHINAVANDSFSSWTLTIVVCGGALMLLAAIGLVIGIVLRRRKRAALNSAPDSAQATDAATQASSTPSKTDATEPDSTTSASSQPLQSDGNVPAPASEDPNASHTPVPSTEPTHHLGPDRNPAPRRTGE